MVDQADGERRVLDWNYIPLGRVKERLDAGGIRTLQVILDENARRLLHTSQRTVELPMQLIFGVRRDEIILDCSVEELSQRNFAPSPPQGQGHT